jgi:hypothetical protein
MDQKLDAPEPSLLIASVLFLMTKHIDQGCSCLRSMIIRQLEFILAHPSDEVTPLLRQACRKLINQWSAYADRCDEQEMKALQETARVLH